MKYLLFCLALVSALPGSLLLLLDKRLMKAAVYALIVTVAWFDETSINFLSAEWYKGTSKGVEVSLIYIVALSLLIALTIKMGKPLWPFADWGSRLFLLYFLLSLPSLQNADNRLYSFFEIWKMIMLLLVFMAVFYYLKATHDVDTIVNAFCVLVLMNFYVVLREHFVGTSQARGIFPHQNSMAMYMGFIGVLFYSRYLNRKESMKTVIYLIGFLVSTAALLRSYSRGAIACLPISIILATELSIMFEFKARKLVLIVPFIVLTGMGVLLMMPKLMMRYENASKQSAQTRKNLALAAWNMIKDKPMNGQGLNNWGIKINPPYKFSEHRKQMGYWEDFKDGIVETTYLLVAAECGIPCLISLLIWYIYYWIIALRLAMKLRNTPYFYIPAGLIGGMTAVYMQSCLEWVLKQQINFLELIIAYAILSYLSVHCNYLRSEYFKYKENEKNLRKRAMNE